MNRRTVVLLVSFCVFGAQAFSQAVAPGPTDAEIWAHFEKWVAALQPLPPGKQELIGQRYAQDLMVSNPGVTKADADARFRRISVVLRRASTDGERVYWNGAFKLGGGPSSPLRLIQEALVKVKPGKALDAGMGRGRNAIYLASVGWDVTGYDMAEDAVKAAQAAAHAAGVKLTTAVAKHDAFVFGENQWDLIICSYNYMNPDDPQWPRVFLPALRQGGLVVLQTTLVPTGAAWQKLLEVWKGFRLMRMEDVDPGIIDDDWAPSRTMRTIKLVARKE